MNTSPFSRRPLRSSPTYARHLQTALFAHAEAVLERQLRFQFAADSVLSQYFRENREMGHTDRGFVAETVFTVLRRWRSLTARLQACDSQATPRHLIYAALLCHQGLNLRELEALLVPGEADLLAKIRSVDLNDMPLAIRADLPDWLVDKLLGDGMDETTLLALAESLNRPAPLDLRINPVKITREAALARLEADGISATATHLSPLGLRLPNKIALSQYPLFMDGSLEVQDEGSQVLGLLLAPKRGELVMDFCAGAGGKTLLLGALMRNTGRLYALDISEKRLGKLKPRLARSGLSNVHPMRIESEHDSRLKRLAGKADRVLVDAPCSGLGTLRRNPDLKWRQTPESIAEMTIRQASILAAASKLVRPGGRLVYATCSLLNDENRDITTAFLATHPQFRLLPANEILKLEKVDGPMLELLPHLHATDGFFAAAFVREASAPPPPDSRPTVRAELVEPLDSVRGEPVEP